APRRLARFVTNPMLLWACAGGGSRSPSVPSKSIIPRPPARGQAAFGGVARGERRSRSGRGIRAGSGGRAALRGGPEAGGQMRPQRGPEVAEDAGLLGAAGVGGQEEAAAGAPVAGIRPDRRIEAEDRAGSLVFPGE